MTQRHIFWHPWLWLALIFGVLPTLIGIVFLGFTHTIGIEILGYIIFILGASAWPVVLDTKWEAAALATTCVGVCFWAAATTSIKSIPIWISTIYHVTVDGMWYMRTVPLPANVKNKRKIVDFSTEDIKCRHYASWNLLAGILHIGMASIIAFGDKLIWKPRVEIQTTNWDTDVMNIATFGTLNANAFLSSASYISGMNHIIQYVLIMSENVYLLNVCKTRKTGNIIRTIDYSISASILLCVVLLLLQTSIDIMSIVGVFGTSACVMIIGYASETTNAIKEAWLYYITGGILYTLLIIALITKMAAANTSDTPEFVVAIWVWLIMTFLIPFPAIHAYGLYNNEYPKLKIEIWNVMFSLFAKLPLLAICYGGMQAASDNATFGMDFGLSLIISIIVGVMIWWDMIY